MHWRHVVAGERSERLYTVDAVPKYTETYYEDYYVPDAPTMLYTFGICSRSPLDHLINRRGGKHTFHYILNGRGWFNGMPFEEGDIVYCSESLPRSISSNRNDPCIYTWVSFSGGKSETYIRQMGITQPYLIYRNHNQTEIERIFYEMMEVDHPEMETALFLESSLLRLMSLSAINPQSAASVSEITARANKRVEAAMQFISEHFRESDLRLEDVEKAANTNKKYLQRIFKEELGISIYQYVTKLRMDAAVALLTNSNYNINEISEYVGYNDRRTFYELFKKHFGTSPIKYTPKE